MPVVRIEHSVPSYEKWKVAFERDPAGRKTSGVRRFRIFRAADDPNYVMIDLDFDTVGEAEAFLRKMEGIWGGPGKDVMRSPRARIAEVVEEKEL